MNAVARGRSCVLVGLRVGGGGSRSYEGEGGREGAAAGGSRWKKEGEREEGEEDWPCLGDIRLPPKERRRREEGERGTDDGRRRPALRPLLNPR